MRLLHPAARHLGRRVLKTPHAAGPAQGVCPDGGCRAGTGRRDPSGRAFTTGRFPHRIGGAARRFPGVDGKGGDPCSGDPWESWLPGTAAFQQPDLLPPGNPYRPNRAGVSRPAVCAGRRSSGFQGRGIRAKRDVDPGDGEGAGCPVFEMVCGKRDKRGTEKTATEVFARPREQPDGSNNDTTKGWIAC